MNTDLHQQLLHETRGEQFEPGSTYGPLDFDRYRATLRAIVELHAPVEDGIAARRWLDCRGCDGGPGAADWPCTTVRTIARELGIEVAP